MDYLLWCQKITESIQLKPHNSSLSSSFISFPLFHTAQRMNHTNRHGQHCSYSYYGVKDNRVTVATVLAGISIAMGQLLLEHFFRACPSHSALDKQVIFHSLCVGDMDYCEHKQADFFHISKHQITIISTFYGKKIRSLRISL